MEIQVSYITSTKSKEVKPIVLTDALESIRGGMVKDKVQRMREVIDVDHNLYSGIKRTLPAYIFSGTFRGGHGLRNLVEYNRLMSIDIDKLCKEEMGRVYKILAKDPYVYAFWISPSGNGYKGIVKLEYGDIDLKDPAYWHKVAFQQLSYYFQTQYNIELDRQCSDIPRLCFVSYDPDLFVKEDAEDFAVEPIREVVIAKKIAVKHEKSFGVYNGTNYRRNEPGRNSVKSRKIMNSILKYLEKRQLSITATYTDWFSVAMAIVTTFNYDVGERYYLRLCRLDGAKHNEEESVSMLRYCYEHSDYNITLGTLIYFAQRMGYKITTKGSR